MFDEEALDRLNSDRNLLNSLFKKEEEEISDDVAISLINGEKKLGRPRGQRNRTNDERSDIGMLATLIGVRETSRVLEVGKETSLKNSHGIISKEVDTELTSLLEDKLFTVRTKATEKLNTVLDVITEESIQTLSDKPEQASRVGMNLARIVEKTTPKVVESQNTTQFVIMQPLVKKVEEYEVIDV